MNEKTAIAIAVIVALIGAGYWYMRGAPGRALAKCRALQAQRSLLSVQGTDVGTIARLDIAIRDCLAAAKAGGAIVDSGHEALAACTDKQEQLEQEFRHFKATDYSDILKRGNTLGSMIRIGSEMARCYSDAVIASDSITGIDEIRKAIRKSIDSSAQRERCYHIGAAGCDRYPGSTETANDAKARLERDEVQIPLRRALAAANAKRDALKQASASPIPGTVEAPI